MSKHDSKEDLTSRILNNPDRCGNYGRNPMFTPDPHSPLHPVFRLPYEKPRVTEIRAPWFCSERMVFWAVLSCLLPPRLGARALARAKRLAWLGGAGWFVLALCALLAACGGDASPGPTDEVQTLDAGADAAWDGFFPCTPPDPIHHPITPTCDASDD